MPASWNNLPRSFVPTWNDATKNNGATIVIGSPIGLLLALTYAVQQGATPWTDATKSAAPTFSTANKPSSSWSKISKSSTPTYTKISKS